MNAITLRHGATTSLASGLFFWVLAAAAVATLHRFLEARFPGSCVVFSVLAILMMSYACMHLAAPRATVNQALLIGVGWVALAIFAEVIHVSHFSPTYPLFGSPAHKAFRDLMLIAWIVAPALFAKAR